MKQEVIVAIAEAYSRSNNLLDAVADYTDQQYAPEIREFCRIKGLEFPAELESIIGKGERARQMEAALQLQAMGGDLATALAAGNPTEKDLGAAADRIAKTVKSIFTTGTGQQRTPEYTLAEYISSAANYDPDAQFKAKMFDGLPFPKGTTSYIGARTSRGKTTVLTSLAWEAIEANKTALFVTLEESGPQIFDRMILNKFHRLGGKMDSGSFVDRLPPWAKSIGGINGEIEEVNPILALKYWLRESHKGRMGKPLDMPPSLEDAIQALKDATDGGRFRVIDPRGMDLDGILDQIKASHADIVFIDYIQKMPTADANSDARQVQIQGTSQKVVDLSVQTGKIIIAGAQFNRIGSAAGQDDVFTDSSFREAGDLEQDAHNAVGIGWTATKSRRFYEVLKSRGSGHVGKTKYLGFMGGYSFAGQTNENYSATQPEQSRTGKGNGGGQGKRATKAAPAGRETD